MILVVYASKHGGTMEIAERIGEQLENEGFQVTVSAVDRVGDISQYQAVILGSAVYIGQWQRKAVKFVKKHSRELADRKVWIFSSGPTGEGNPIELLDGWTLPKKLKPLIEEIEPEDITVFHGVLSREKLGGLARFMIDKVESPVGDYRNWQMITAWAEQIASKLKKS
ncbi:MAG: flavodoxin domain-containing protein [Bacteroidales bacterium]|nr:flavodoxin domain-containing protein [Bacteroidales bacterium]